MHFNVNCIMIFLGNSQHYRTNLGRMRSDPTVTALGRIKCILSHPPATKTETTKWTTKTSRSFVVFNSLGSSCSCRIYFLVHREKEIGSTNIKDFVPKYIWLFIILPMAGFYREQKSSSKLFHVNKPKSIN